jgi:uncharacterized membrane protein
MTASIFLARLLGPAFILLAIVLFTDRKRLLDILRELVASPLWIYFAGFLGLFGGLALVLTHNLWTADWRVIITLIAWITLIRAVVTFLWPNAIIVIAHRIAAQPIVLTGAAGLNLLIGLALSYFGYLHSLITSP